MLFRSDYFTPWLDGSPNVDKGHVNLKPIPDILEFCRTGSNRTGWEMMGFWKTGMGFVNDVCLFVCPVLVCFILPCSSVFHCVCLFVFVCAFPCMVVLPNGDVIRNVSCLSGYCPSPTRALNLDKEGGGTRWDGMGCGIHPPIHSAGGYEITSQTFTSPHPDSDRSATAFRSNRGM